MYRTLKMVLFFIVAAGFISACASAEGLLGEETAARIPDDADQVRISVDAPPDTAVEYVHEFLQRKGVGIDQESMDGRRITSAAGNYYKRGESKLIFQITPASTGSFIYVTGQRLAGRGWMKEKAGQLQSDFPQFVEFLTDLASLERMTFINSEEQDGGPIISDADPQE